MSRTLFFYIFKDLLRVFLLTAGALAGIMSFGGLLRPLTEHGLDAGQVGKVLTYFLPAMTTYSLPIAALFATSCARFEYTTRSTLSVKFGTTKHRNSRLTRATVSPSTAAGAAIER